MNITTVRRLLWREGGVFPVMVFCAVLPSDMVHFIATVVIQLSNQYLHDGLFTSVVVVSHQAGLVSLILLQTSHWTSDLKQVRKHFSISESQSKTQFHASVECLSSNQSTPIRCLSVVSLPEEEEEEPVLLPPPDYSNDAPSSPVVSYTPPTENKVSRHANQHKVFFFQCDKTINWSR